MLQRRLNVAAVPPAAHPCHNHHVPPSSRLGPAAAATASARGTGLKKFKMEASLSLELACSASLARSRSARPAANAASSQDDGLILAEPILAEADWAETPRLQWPPRGEG
jgi:hypothetical protein